MKNTSKTFLKTNGLAIRADYLFSKKDYSVFINNLSTLYELLSKKAFNLPLSFELKTPEVNTQCPFPTYKYQFPRKTSNFSSIISPNTLDGLDYATGKKSSGAYLGFSSYSYSQAEHYIAAKVFQETFLLSPEHETLEGLLELLGYCSEKEIAFIKKHLIKDKARILDIFGASAYNFLLKLFAYTPPKQGFSTVITKKQYYTSAIKKNLFAKNNKFIVLTKAELFSHTAHYIKENYFRIFGHNSLSPVGNARVKLDFNLYFPKQGHHVTAVAFVHEEHLPKNQVEVARLLKDMDALVCNTMNYYNNLLAIYYYLIKVFKGEILLNKL